MEKLLACCGVDCLQCPTYIATRDNNNTLRAETAILWGRQLDVDVAPEDINCRGCLQDEVHLGYCAICKIRQCCRGRGLENCAHCSDYVCDLLQYGFDFMCDPLEMGTPDNLPARDNLEELRQRLQKKPQTGYPCV